MIRNLVNIADFSKEEINQIYNITSKLKNEVKNNIKHHHLENKTLIMLFEKPSARTRISFETGMFQLGGKAIFLGPNDLALGKRESIEDLARVLSRYNNMIMARVFDHDHLVKLAKFSTVPVINGLTDYNHPCQIIADILTVWEHRKTLDDLKIVYMGDGNNIVHSWLQLATVFPMTFVCCGPEGFEPDQKTVVMVKNSNISKFELSHDPESAVKGADIIYTDVWASMGQKEEEKEREKIFFDYQVNKNLMLKTGKKTLFMHCLPAERGREVTDEVMEAPYSIVFDEAENRMHAQNAIMVYLTS